MSEELAQLESILKEAESASESEKKLTFQKLHKLL